MRHKIGPSRAPDGSDQADGCPRGTSRAKESALSGWTSAAGTGRVDALIVGPECRVA
ncbi:MAG: hypothetical protein QM695_03510 [Micropruina sp.]